MVIPRAVSGGGGRRDVVTEGEARDYVIFIVSISGMAFFDLYFYILLFHSVRVKSRERKVL